MDIRKYGTNEKRKLPHNLVDNNESIPKKVHGGPKIGVHYEQMGSGGLYKCIKCNITGGQKSVYNHCRSRKCYPDLAEQANARQQHYYSSHQEEERDRLNNIYKKHKQEELALKEIEPEGSFRCTYPNCDKTFHTQKVLTYHLSSHKKLEEYKKHKQEELALKEIEPEGSFRCTYPNCDKTFHTQKVLTYHLSSHKNHEKSCIGSFFNNKDVCGNLKENVDSQNQQQDSQSTTESEEICYAIVQKERRFCVYFVLLIDKSAIDIGIKQYLLNNWFVTSCIIKYYVGKKALGDNNTHDIGKDHDTRRDGSTIIDELRKDPNLVAVEVHRSFHSTLDSSEKEEVFYQLVGQWRKKKNPSTVTLQWEIINRRTELENAARLSKLEFKQAKTIGYENIPLVCVEPACTTDHNAVREMMHYGKIHLQESKFKVLKFNLA